MPRDRQDEFHSFGDVLACLTETFHLTRSDHSSIPDDEEEARHFLELSHAKKRLLDILAEFPEHHVDSIDEQIVIRKLFPIKKQRLAFSSRVRIPEYEAEFPRKAGNILAFIFGCIAFFLLSTVVRVDGTWQAWLASFVFAAIAALAFFIGRRISWKYRDILLATNMGDVLEIIVQSEHQSRQLSGIFNATITDVLKPTNYPELVLRSKFLTSMISGLPFSELTDLCSLESIITGMETVKQQVLAQACQSSMRQFHFQKFVSIATFQL